MRIVSNVGNDRVLDILNSDMSDGATLLVVSSEFSLFAFEQLRQRLMTVKEARLVLPSVGVDGLNLFGSDFDRPARNLLQLRWLARSCAKWLENKADLRFALKSMPQSMIIIEGQQTNSAVVGSCAFTTDGLGVAPSNPYAFIQHSESGSDVANYRKWFEAVWNSTAGDNQNATLTRKLQTLAEHTPPRDVYFHILHQLFKDLRV